ncbi:MAG: phosphate-selective porin OprO/OprP [Sphingobacteriales bacterium]|jgi:phosphate-selective porin OprO/OprP
MKKIINLLLILSILTISGVFAQDITNNTFGKGIKIKAADTTFSMKFSARIQTLYEGTMPFVNNKIDLGDVDHKFLTRRARLKFSGFAYSPKLSYKMEIGLSNRDISGASAVTSGSPRLILDAVVGYNFYKNFTILVGQTKLPGNRERVISSSSLQLVDRSALNSKFTLDRDAGVQILHKMNVNGVVIKEDIAISIGEGRNRTAKNNGGLEYTGRVELLPFGEFKGKGDYVASDLNREKTPKLAIGLTYDKNYQASLERSNLGSELAQTRTINTFFADLMYKYQGFSLMFEFANRNTGDIVPNFSFMDGSGNLVTQSFYTGQAYNIASGYLFPNNIELSARITNVTPEEVTGNNELNQYTFGVSKYFVGHSLKVQSDISVLGEKSKEDKLMFRLQLELGF